MVIRKSSKFLFFLLVSLFLTFLLVMPRVAKTYVLDPDTGGMFWPIVAGLVVGSLFYAKGLAVWIKNPLSTDSRLANGFAFATLFAMAASPLCMVVFEGHALPRFNDVFVIGIVLTAYLFRWEPAMYLLGVSMLVSAWVLPPSASFRVQGFQEWYRLFSFAAISLFLVWLITRTKTRRHAVEDAPSGALNLHRFAAGAD